MIVGSPSYLSPEQINGEPVTRATDLWQLGVTLYDMLYGCPPFDRDDQQSTLFAIIGSDPPPLDCDEPLASTVRGLLNKHPGERPTSAELRAVLEQHASTSRTAENDTTTRRPSSGAPRRDRGKSGWRRPALVVGAVLVVVCSVAAGVVLGRRSGTSPEHPHMMPVRVGALGVPASVDPALPAQASTVSWDSELSGPDKDENSVDMGKLDFDSTACLNRSPEPDREFRETPCAGSHDLEVFDSYELPALPGAVYPPELLTAAATDFCRTSYAFYGKNSWLRGRNIRLTSMYPSPARWNLGAVFSNVVYCAASPVDEKATMSASGLQAE